MTEIEPIINARAELTDGGMPGEPIVLSTRIRLARNLAQYAFPGRSSDEMRRKVQGICFDALEKSELLASSHRLDLEQLDKLSSQVLVERRLISRELTEKPSAAGVTISRDQHLSIMINEEDHLRLQAVRSGFNLRKAWADINALDSELENFVDYAFSRDLGYLTACPTNVGTGMRASAMLHLPGLVFGEHMEQVVRMVNQLGMAVRGCFGEGSEATGSIFQISNQQTLGESEDTILNRLINVLHAIIEQEKNARQVFLENNPSVICDKMGRAFGILMNACLLNSEEAMSMLSMLRLAIDLRMLPEIHRDTVDRLMIESQPGHIQFSAHGEIDPNGRDIARAQYIREQLSKLPPLNYNISNKKTE
jgi:protein arginine kinase